jgi:hypothetical protein
VQQGGMTILKGNIDGNIPKNTPQKKANQEKEEATISTLVPPR